MALNKSPLPSSVGLKGSSSDHQESGVANQSDLEQDASNTYYAVRMGKERAGRMEAEGNNNCPLRLDENSLKYFNWTIKLVEELRKARGGSQVRRSRTMATLISRDGKNLAFSVHSIL